MVHTEAEALFLLNHRNCIVLGRKAAQIIGNVFSSPPPRIIAYLRLAIYIMLGCGAIVLTCTIFQFLYRRFSDDRRGGGVRLNFEYNPVALEEARLGRVVKATEKHESTIQKEINSLKRALRRKERDLEFAHTSRTVAETQLHTARSMSREYEEVCVTEAEEIA
jgi:hypothetical protein